jgi:hypothetical protein
MKLGAKPMTLPTNRRSFFAAALALAGVAALSGCATPPAVLPTAADIQGLKPSGRVTITQVFLSGTGIGTGTLTTMGRAYPFTMAGELNGLGAISGIEASGEVYNLKDVSQFAGAYIQGSIPASLGSASTEIWMKNTNGVIIRLHGLQNGVTVSSGRYEIFVRLGG